LDILNLRAFLTATVLLMFNPGVDMALVTRQIVAHGRRAAFRTLTGPLLGGFMQQLRNDWTTSGLVVSSAAYTTVKLVGAAYLVAFGIQTIWVWWRNGSIHGNGETCSSLDRLVVPFAASRFLLGFLSDITNPKVALFFLTSLPQFVVSRSDPTARSPSWARSSTPSRPRSRSDTCSCSTASRSGSVVQLCDGSSSRSRILIWSLSAYVSQSSAADPRWD
jgi:threonine/homoserine/homoserine lactone efflux protein